MSERAMLSPWAGVPDDELRQLIARGKAQGELTLDEVMVVFKSVELDATVIEDVRAFLRDEGITLDESVDDLEFSGAADLDTFAAEIDAELDAERESGLDTDDVIVAVLDGDLDETVDETVAEGIDAELDPTAADFDKELVAYGLGAEGFDEDRPTDVVLAVVPDVAMAETGADTDTDTDVVADVVLEVVRDTDIVTEAADEGAVTEPAAVVVPDDDDDGDPVGAERAARARARVDLDPLGRIEDEVPGRRRRSNAVRDTSRTSSVGAGSSDPVRMYLKEIGRVPLLSGADEVALAKRIERGTNASERLADLAAENQMDSLDWAERRRLEREVADGDRAKNELTQANLRLVVSIAKRYVGRGMLILDLIQEGNLGLMRAVEKFDYTKGFKFSTYATWWIRQAITRAIADQARTIRIPVHMVESINKVHRVQRQMLQELEREPTIEELADKVDMTPARVREIMRISQDPLSLDSPVGEEDDSNLADFIEDQQAEAPAEMAARKMLGDAVLEALDELNEREKAVVRLRFGLDDGQARTLEEVGKEFGVTRERIRQIESKTLAKLRHPHRSQKLRDYLDGE